MLIRFSGCEKDPLPPIENGTFSASSKNMGDKATLTCDSGYYVNGSNEIECQSTSLWTEPSATCEIATGKTLSQILC